MPDVVDSIATTHADRAQFDASRAKTLPVTSKLQPGLWAIALPLPTGMPPHTLTYALRGRGGDVAIIDPGWGTEANWSRFQRELVASGLELERISLVVSTHFHVDHVGLGPRIRDASGARLAVHTADAAELECVASGAEADPDYEQWGVPRSIAKGLRKLRYGDDLDPIEFDVLLEDGDLLDEHGHELQVVHTPGHTAGHVCLIDHARGAVFTGDHVLPEIHPGIFATTRDPVGDYLRSLDRVAAAGGPLVCPGHGYAFYGLAARCAQSRQHQLTRNEEVEAAMQAHPAATVWEIASAVSWTDGWENLSGWNLALALAQVQQRMRYARLHASGAARRTDD